MTKPEPDLPEKVRKALKASPSFTPPESFYQRVLDRTVRRRGRAGEPAKESSSPLLPRSAVPWFWGWPVRGLAAACVVMVMVLVAREQRREEPPMVFEKLDSATDKRWRASEEDAVRRARPVSRDKLGSLAPKKQAPASMGGLSESREVQGRLHRDLTGMVGRPSPFEGVDERIPQAAARRGGLALVPSGSAIGARQEVVGKDAPAQAAMADSEARLAERPDSLKASEALEASEESENIWQGKQSRIHEFRTVVITNSRDWHVLWNEQMNSRQAPPLDFSRVMVVGVFLGDRPHPGFGIEIADIKTLPDQLAVEYQETLPDPIGLYPQVLAQPFVLSAIPRTPLPVHFHYLRPKSPQ